MTPENDQNLDLSLKTVGMPDREILARQLQQIGVLGISEQTNAFFQRFTEYLSDKTVNAPGVYMAWTLAGTDTLSGYPPVVGIMMDVYFDWVVDAIIPDKDVAENAKTVRSRTLDTVENMLKASEPKVEDLGPEDSLDDLQRYSQARKIADIIFEYASSPRTGAKIWMEDWRDQGANPYYNQTHRGFFLEQYYNTPGKLWTPWGEYDFGGSSSGWDDKTRQKVLDRLGATEYLPVRHEEYGEVGPIYAIHKIDDVELPDPVSRPRSSFKSYEDAKKAWEKLTKDYHRSKGETPPLTVEEKFVLDDAILEERGKKEPPVSDDDIKELMMLAFYVGKVVKFTMDQGKTWHYTRIKNHEAQYFANGNLGFRTDNEVMPSTQVHSSSALTVEDFNKGLVVRPTTEEETKDLKFSYDFKALDNQNS